MLWGRSQTLRARFSTDMIVSAGVVILGTAIVTISWLHRLSTLAFVIFVSGAAWVLFISLINSVVQNLAPDWVRARVLAIFTLVYMGSFALGSATWGGIAEHQSVRLSLIYSGFGTAGSAILALIARLPDSTADLTPWNHWRMPVIVKEVGWGIAADLVCDLLDAGVAAVDVAGAGGTSWSEVERHRISDPLRRRVAAAFAGWGIPTADAVMRARAAAPHAVLIASGGVRSGIDAAKAIALGADTVGIAGPLLRAAAHSDEDLADGVDVIVEELRLAMFCTGAATVGELRSVARLRRAQ